MDVSQPLTAERILATYDAAELVRIFKEYGEERFSRQIARASWRVETRSRLPPPHSSTVWSMKWCRKPTARRAIPPNASSRRCALKSTANWTSSPPHCRRREPTACRGTTGGGVLSFARRQNRQIVHGTRAASGCSGWPACHTAGCPTVFHGSHARCHQGRRT